MVKQITIPPWTHAGIFGTTGTGKSVLGETLCEIEYLKGKKIIDLQNDRTMESVGFYDTLYLCLKNLTGKTQKNIGKHKEIGIKINTKQT